MGPDYRDVMRLNRKLEKDGYQACLSELEERFRRVLIEAVSHVPFYRNLGISATECANASPFEIVKSFPYISKQDVMDDMKSFVSERAPRLGTYQVNSGGSTGQGIVLLRNKKLADIEAAFLDHLWASCGWVANRSKTVRIASDSRRNVSELPTWKDHNRLMVSPYHLTEEWLPKIYDEIVSFAPEYFHGYPSCIVEVARFIQRTGKSPIPVKAIILTSEPVLPHDIQMLQRAFQSDIHATYGLTERTNLAAGKVSIGEIEIKYKLNPLYAFQENYIHADGRAEIVGTSYWNDLMPLIRYRTADFGEIRGSEISNLEGRDMEYLITKDGRKVAGLSIDILDDSIWTYVSAYQLYQLRPGEIEVRMVSRSKDDAAAAQRFLADRIRLFGHMFDFTLKAVDEIPRTASGKARLVVRSTEF